MICTRQRWSKTDGHGIPHASVSVGVRLARVHSNLAELHYAYNARRSPIGGVPPVNTNQSDHANYPGPGSRREIVCGMLGTEAPPPNVNELPEKQSITHLLSTSFVDAGGVASVHYIPTRACPHIKILSVRLNQNQMPHATTGDDARPRASHVTRTVY